MINIKSEMILEMHVIHRSIVNLNSEMIWEMLAKHKSYNKHQLWNDFGNACNT